MRCFTDDELRRGVDAVVDGWDRCRVCGSRVEDHRPRDAHVFDAVNLIDVFLKAARSDDREVPYGQS